MWVLATKPGSAAGATSAPNSEPSLRPLKLIILKNLFPLFNNAFQDQIPPGKAAEKFSTGFWQFNSCQEQQGIKKEKKKKTELPGLFSLWPPTGQMAR